jgi:hypothetical protein
LSRYFIVNENRDLIKEIKEEEYENYKIVNSKLQDYSNVFDCFMNFKKSQENINNYLKLISEKEDRSINEMYTDCKFIFLINIMLGRIFIDNVKAYCKKSRKIELRKYITKMEQRDELKMLKLLRNFGQHHSLPFNNFRITKDLIKEECYIDLLIDAKIIKNNFYLNDSDKEYIHKFKNKEISIVAYNKIWTSSLNLIFKRIRDNYFNDDNNLEKQLLFNLFSEYLEMKNNNIVAGLTKVTKASINLFTFEDIVPVNFILVKDLLKLSKK